MKITQLKISKLVTPLVLAALLIPAISSGFPTDTNTYQVNAVRVGGFTFADPDGPANNLSHPDWGSATATDVPLAYIIFASANAKGGFDNWALVNDESVRHLSVKSIHDGGEILFRVEFADETFNPEKDDVPRFFDALALMIPYSAADYPGCVAGPEAEPLIHMGMRCDGLDEHGDACTADNPGDCKCCPANIHFWRPDKVEVENIVTNGMGTTLETDETDDPLLFHAAQDWSNGVWTVVMGRAMIGPPNPEPAHPDAIHVGAGGHMVTLEAGASYDTVWANWDGDRDERNGSKFIGLWGKLIIAP
ncbi:MAG: ethylbenzene dehydrogenase-related protein [Pseudomonadota bacterium]